MKICQLGVWPTVSAEVIGVAEGQVATEEMLVTTVYYYLVIRRYTTIDECDDDLFMIILIFNEEFMKVMIIVLWSQFRKRNFEIRMLMEKKKLKEIPTSLELVFSPLQHKFI